MPWSFAANESNGLSQRMGYCLAVAMPKTTLSAEQLQPHLLEILSKRQKGLTHSQLRSQCGASWRRGLTYRNRAKGEECTVSEFRDYVHELWQDGVIVVEPPTSRNQSTRIWSPDAIAGKFGSNTINSQPPKSASFSGSTIRSTYQRLSREIRSPYVFICELQERSKVPLPLLHDYLLGEERTAKANLSTGDWAGATETERAAVLESGGRKFIKVKLT